MAINVHTTPRIGYEPDRWRATRKAVREDLDWLGLARTLWRRKLFLLGFVVIVVGATAAYVSHLAPAFEAQALVMLDERQTRVAPAIPDLLTDVPVGEDGAQRQILLIHSRGMAERLIEQLNLHMLPEFNGALRPRAGGLAGLLPSALLSTAVLERLPRAWADALTGTASATTLTDQERATRLRIAIVDNVLEHIVAEPASHASVISLKFISADPNLAALGANTLARLYLVEQLETKQTASRNAHEFLEHEIERLRASVAAAEQAIQDYRRKTGLIKSGAQPMNAQQLTELTTQLVLARSQRAESEARLRQVERLIASDGSLEAAAQMLESPTLTQLRARELELARQRAELAAEYGAQHPRMVSLSAELATLESRKRLEIRQIAQRLRDEVQVLHSRETALEQNIDRIKGQLAESGEAGIELAALERDAKADRELLATYINRATEIASQQKAQQPDARIISRAVLPESPTYPRRKLIFGVALFGALLAGALLVFGLESLDNTIRSSEQIDDLIGLPALGLVPALAHKRDGALEDYVLNRPNSSLGEAVHSLRTAMLLAGMGPAPKTVLLTSSVPGEGKTSMAMSLARVHARSGRRTLIVDCDLRRPRLRETAGAPNGDGLSEVLLRERTLAEVVRTDERSGASYITAGAPVFDPAALLASADMQRLLEEVGGRYDLVLLDSPPVLSVSDARVLSQMVDKTVFLVHWGKTRRQDVQIGVKQLIEAGADLAGLVLTRVDVKKHAKYGYRDSGHYYDTKYTKYYSTG